MKSELEGSLNRLKEGCGWRHGQKGSVSRAALSAHLKTSFYGYTPASLHLGWVNFILQWMANARSSSD